MGDAGDVGFLETVLTEEGTGDIAGEGEDGGAIHPRRADACDEVRRAGAAGPEAGPHAATGAGVAICHVRRSLFVPHEDVADAGELGEGVVEREHDASGVPEDRVDSFALEAIQHHLSASHARHEPGSFPRQPWFPALPPVRGIRRPPRHSVVAARGWPWARSAD